MLFLGEDIGSPPAKPLERNSELGSGKIEDEGE